MNAVLSKQQVRVVLLSVGFQWISNVIIAYVNNGRSRMVKVNPLVECEVGAIFYISHLFFFSNLERAASFAIRKFNVQATQNILSVILRIAKSLRRRILLAVSWNSLWFECHDIIIIFFLIWISVGTQLPHLEHTNQILYVVGAVDELHCSTSSKSVGNESFGE